MAKKYFNEFRVRLEKKRMQVLAMIPEVVPLGVEKDESGEVIPYTVAEDVREVYYAAFRQVGLSVQPVAGPGMMPQIILGGRLFAVAGCYEITDIDTGYSVICWGAGLGANGDWAGNTAQTRAMKQFMLASFMANWKDPTRPSFEEQIEKFGGQAEVILSHLKKKKSTSDEIMDRLMPAKKAKKKKTKKRKAGKKNGRTHKKPVSRVGAKSKANRKHKKKSGGGTIKKSKRSRVKNR